VKILYCFLILCLSFHLNAQQSLSQSSDRIVLMELFSSTTCPGCAQADTRIKSWLNEHPESSKIHIIKYPMWGPGDGCFFYHENPVPVTNRVSYYERITRVPTVFVDGEYQGITIASWFESIDEKLTVESPLEINVNTERNNLELKLEVTIQTKDGSLLPANTTLRTAIVESDIEYSAPNGSKVQDHMHRAMFPDANGVSLDSESYLRIAYTGNLRARWNLDNLKVIVFVQQENEAQEILGTAITAID